MSGDLIEGGNFKCFVHQKPDGSQFETASRAEWDEHCKTEGHKIEGTAPCIYCQTTVEFKGLPYQSVGKVVPAVCDKCKEEYLGVPAAGGSK
jgi:hypothetical protein